MRIRGVRGFEGIKELEVPLGDKAIKVCVVNGLRNVEVIMNRMKAGEHFDLIEVMACPNGCIGGAGQPKATIDEKKERSVNLYNADKLYTCDVQKKIRLWISFTRVSSRAESMNCFM